MNLLCVWFGHVWVDYHRWDKCARCKKQEKIPEALASYKESMEIAYRQADQAKAALKKIEEERRAYQEGRIIPAICVQIHAEAKEVEQMRLAMKKAHQLTVSLLAIEPSPSGSAVDLFYGISHELMAIRDLNQVR